jgi:hypothetical protein
MRVDEARKDARTAHGRQCDPADADHAAVCELLETERGRRASPARHERPGRRWCPCAELVGYALKRGLISTERDASA